MPIRLKQPLLTFLFTLLLSACFAQRQELKIWFNQPANDWNHALPVGNGSLGAMVFGDPESERIQLNEETVWLGTKEDFVNPGAKRNLEKIRTLLFEGKYAEAEAMAQEHLMGEKRIPSTYQTLGDLVLEFQKPTAISNYRRELDLTTAIARVTYTADGVNYTREIFSSFPDQCLIVRLTADKKGALNFVAGLKREGENANPLVIVTKDEVKLSETLSVSEETKKQKAIGEEKTGVSLYSRMKITNEGGEVIKESGKGLRVKGADAVIIYLTAGTDYWGGNPIKETQAEMDAVILKSYEGIRKDHIADYQQYFNRVSFSLTNNPAPNIPTNIRLQNVKHGATDLNLIETYYQFGRYMLISSSRPGGLPANLQGIWADGMWPPWSADYHININIQMNYWLAETTNLSELHLPFLEFVDKLRADGNKTAKAMYGVEGAVAHFTTDVFHFTEPYGQTDWAMWPMGQAWSSTHYWQHYQFTEDKDFLSQLGYPAMKDAATFCKNFLVTNPKTGKLVSGPSISPENKFVTVTEDTVSMVMGPTMDHMIIRDLLTSTIEASKILNVDADFRAELEKTLANLSPIQLGSDGRIMEWTEEFKEENLGHRHISHLYGLYPANQITISTPELLSAARKTIDTRLANGGGHTGWSRAWIINFFARLQDGEQAYNNLIALLQKSTLDNLFDNHPPFQIDGNFGATAGITEMLMQSHNGEIHILPALPKAWSSGEIKGIVARGGFEVSISWDKGKLTQVSILSKLGNECKLHYGDKIVIFETEKGSEYKFNGLLEN